MPDLLCLSLEAPHRGSSKSEDAAWVLSLLLDLERVWKIIHSRDFHAKLKCEGLGASLVRHHVSVVKAEARTRRVTLGLEGVMSRVF